ncbi:MAG: DUF4129 domain-containing protein [Acidobacteria bacterium]|nr:DUF4129 domain-containing protein [Acidobacteriota bacterium]
MRVRCILLFFALLLANVQAHGTTSEFRLEHAGEQVVAHPEPAEAGRPNTGADSQLTPGEYRQQLRTLLAVFSGSGNVSKSAARSLSGSLPLAFKVKDGPAEYEVPLYAVHHALAKAAAGEKDWEAARLQALSTVSMLLSEADSATRSVDYQSAHRRVSDILSQREFRAVHGPTLWSQFKGRFYDFLFRLLGRVFRRVAPWLHLEYVIYGIAAVILLAFAGWIWRMLPSKPAEVQLTLAVPPPSARHWSEWLREASAMAGENRWREGIHLAYWAGISFLEGAGRWRPDRARTPREYLSLIPDHSTERATVNAMTAEFERAWYAQRPSGPAEFARILAHLEALGCR